MGPAASSRVKDRETEGGALLARRNVAAQERKVDEARVGRYAGEGSGKA